MQKNNKPGIEPGSSQIFYRPRYVDSLAYDNGGSMRMFQLSAEDDHFLTFIKTHVDSATPKCLPMPRSVR
jgi:hypothetical protein